MAVNIFVINSDDKVVLLVDEGLIPSAASRVCRKLNKIWSSSCGDESTRLSCIKGYIFHSKNELSYTTACRLFKEQCK